uniref:N-terminal Ras-GEF domain-containing protein n=1 Tax=Glossina morsitans morsitans TaxID=37546 RepID=A0A1B0FGP8_GLOMM
MAMYYYASKISAIACGTRCKQTVLQKSRGQRDRDKCTANSGGKTRSHIYTDTDDDDDTDDREGIRNDGGRTIGIHMQGYNNDDNDFTTAANGRIYVTDTNEAGTTETSVSTLFSTNDTGIEIPSSSDGIRYRRRHSEQLDICDTGLQKLENSSDNTSSYMDKSVEVQYDVPKNTHKRSQCDVNFESSVLGSGGIMYINGRIVSGPLESLIDVLVPKNINDLDKEFIFSFLLSSRLYLRPHVLLGKLLSSVPDSESLESLVAFLAEWTNKFPYDYRDERMMSHVKHIVARCSHTRLEATVSEILSALLKRLTDLERHEEELRSCQITADKSETKLFECRTSTQYAQILCRIEKKLAKHIGPEEFLQCSSNILLDKQKKWDQPCSLGGPPGAQDPKKTCNLETYLDWSARLRLFVCNEILQCGGIRDRSKTVELWSGVAQYCLLVGNYNSATAILETLESPPIARLKITVTELLLDFFKTIWNESIDEVHEILTEDLKDTGKSCYAVFAKLR